LGGGPLSIEKIVAAAFATVCITALSWFFHGSRTGLALRAVASDQQGALAMGVDLHRHFAITGALGRVLSLLAGTLWSFASGGGFGIELLGFKVFPIVILGGLDSLPGTIIGAFAVGILESLVAGYVDPIVGGGFSHVASYLVLIATLFVRPWGLFGRPDIARRCPRPAPPSGFVDAIAAGVALATVLVVDDPLGRGVRPEEAEHLVSDHAEAVRHLGRDGDRVALPQCHAAILAAVDPGFGDAVEDM